MLPALRENMVPDQPLMLLVRKLRTRGPISAEAEAAVLALPYSRRTYDPPAYIVREGSTRIDQCSLVVSGYAFRQKLTTDGSRQILSLHMRGDLLDLQHLFLDSTDHSVQALTQVDALTIDRTALLDLILREPTVGRAMWIDGLIDSSIFCEWITNVGQRDARARVAHLLCEFALRMKVAGLGDGMSCHLPMTQEQIGDAVGLTSVHVNRTLKALETEGIIQRTRRDISFNDWKAIVHAADFTPNYLHLHQQQVLEPG